MSSGFIPEGPRVQLRMNFNETGRNRFKERMDNAVFSILFETKVPCSDADINAAVERNSWVRDAITDTTEIPSALALINDDTEKLSKGICEYASELIPEDRDRHLLYVTGRNRDPEMIAGLLNHLRIEGFKNAVCVSGKPILERGGRKSFHEESTSILQINAEQEQPLFCGATVNPYKYEPAAVLAQYAKLIRKVNSGAVFAVAQAGWDLKKLQELRWYTYRQGLTMPLISRYIFLSPEKAEEICRGRFPEFIISKDFMKTLRREMEFSRAQFEAAQWHRLQLYAAGAKLLGYSAIQLSGIENLSQAQTAAGMIAQAFREYKNLDEWITAQYEYFSQIDITPYPNDYYLYDQLLKPAVEYSAAQIQDAHLPKPVFSEMLKYRLAALLFKHAEEQPVDNQRILKKILTGCTGNCKKCHLPECMYQCPEKCFCGFADGPCGEVLADNQCPYTERECNFAAMIRLAVQLRDFSLLEKK